MTETTEDVTENIEQVEQHTGSLRSDYDHAELLSGCEDYLKPVADAAVGKLLYDAVHGTGNYRLMGAVLRADLLPTLEPCVDDLMKGVALMHRQASDMRTDGKRIPSVLPAIVVAESSEEVGKRPVCLFLFVERDLVPDAALLPLFNEMNVRLAGDPEHNFGFAHDAKGAAFRIMIQTANRVLETSGYPTRILAPGDTLPPCTNPNCPIHGKKRKIPVLNMDRAKDMMLPPYAMRQFLRA